MKVPDTFCKAPFSSAVIDCDGKLLPCCEYVQHLSTISHHHVSDFDQWWISGLMPLRQKMILGEPDDGCRHCRTKESNPQEYSLRRDSNRKIQQSALQFMHDEPLGPIELVEIRLGNVCNLGCIMCYPGASSTIAAERINHQQVFRSIGISTDHDQNVDRAWYKNQEHWSWALALVANCRYLHISGGEPFMNPRMLELLDAVSDDCSISINTNMTMINEEIADKLRDLAEVKLVISLEGVGDHNGYVRWPSEWSTIERAIDDLRSLSMNINHVLQHTSIFSIPQLIVWADEKRLPINFGQVFEGSVQGWGTMTINSAHPKDHEQFSRWLGTYDGPYKKVLEGWAGSYVFSPERHDFFKTYVGVLDSIRGTDFQAVFQPNWA